MKIFIKLTQKIKTLSENWKPFVMCLSLLTLCIHNPYLNNLFIYITFLHHSEFEISSLTKEESVKLKLLCKLFTYFGKPINFTFYSLCHTLPQCIALKLPNIEVDGVFTKENYCIFKFYPPFLICFCMLLERECKWVSLYEYIFKVI